MKEKIFRIPRKLKKLMKKGVEWDNYVEEKREEQEKEESLNLIFTHDYSNVRKIVRKIMRKGR